MLPQSDEGQVEAGSAPPAQLYRALDILECLAQEAGPKTLGDIARHIGAPKASTHRLLAGLVSRGYAAQDQSTGTYTLGIRCFEVGSQWVKGLDLRAVAGPSLRELNSTTQETVHLAVYDQAEAVYVEKLDSPRPVLAQSFVGRRSPAFTVSTGRALLAHQPKAEIDRVLAGELPQYTDHTITDPQELAALLQDVRERGIAINQCSYREGVCGVAVPIRDHTGAVVASVGVCVPQHRFGEEIVPALSEATFAAGQHISKELGFVPQSTRFSAR